MGLLDRLAGSGATRRPALTVSPAWIQTPTLAPGSELEVVGESNYQPALEWAGWGRTPDGCRMPLVMAELVREPRNPHDRNAVRVDVGGHTVGYVPRDIAPQLHPIIDHLWSNGFPATCRATLTGGWDRGWQGAGTIGIVLDVRHPATTFDPSTMPSLPGGKRVSVTREEHYADHLSTLLQRRPEVDVLGQLRVVERDPHAKTAAPTIEVWAGGGTIGYLTAKMSARYVPFLAAAQRGGLPTTSRTLIQQGTKVEAWVRLPGDPERLCL